MGEEGRRREALWKKKEKTISLCFPSASDVQLHFGKQDTHDTFLRRQMLLYFEYSFPFHRPAFIVKHDIIWTEYALVTYSGDVPTSAPV